MKKVEGSVDVVVYDAVRNAVWGKVSGAVGDAVWRELNGAVGGAVWDAVNFEGEVEVRGVIRELR